MGTDAGSFGGSDAGPTPDPCMGLDFAGECRGDTARWCENGRVEEVDCEALGRVCGDAAGSMRCVEVTPPTPTCGNPTEQEQLEYTNGARADAGLGPLECDELMTTVARAHAQDMCDRDYFSHTSQDGRSPFDRMRDAGVSYRTAGENIAWGQQTPSAVHTSWMNSSGHRRNILGSGYGRIGIGYVECGGRPYWVQVFADLRDPP